MYPICWKYVLQILHGQDSGFHYLIPDLKRSIVSTSFKFAVILCQIFRPIIIIIIIVISQHSSWWRRLEDIFRLQKMSLRRLDQDQYTHLGHASMFWRRLAKTSSRHLQDVLNTPSRRLAKAFSRRFEDVFKKYSRHLQDVL